MEDGVQILNGEVHRSPRQNVTVGSSGRPDAGVVPHDHLGTGSTETVWGLGVQDHHLLNFEISIWASSPTWTGKGLMDGSGQISLSLPIRSEFRVRRVTPQTVYPMYLWGQLATLPQIDMTKDQNVNSLHLKASRGADSSRPRCI